jgi:hypothetical protein
MPVLPSRSRMTTPLLVVSKDQWKVPSDSGHRSIEDPKGADLELGGTDVVLLTHGVGRVFDSPIPVGAYLAGGALTVLASFVIRAIISAETPHSPERKVVGETGTAVIAGVMRFGSLLAFVLLIVFAVMDPDPGFTAAPLLFWVGLVVGMAMLSSIIAGLWGRVDPWTFLEETLSPPLETRDSLPTWLAPVFIYLLLWFELISGLGFEPLAVMIFVLIYTLIRPSFKPRLGKAWARIDPFSMLFSFAGRAAPFAYRDNEIVYKGQKDLHEAEPMPTYLFASLIILLAGTTLDNARETVAWSDLLRATRLEVAPSWLVESLAFLILTIPFLLPFLLGAWWASRQTASPGTLVEARHLGWSLIPIGIAYLLAHNTPLMMTGVPRLIDQLLEPFGVSLFPGYAASPAAVWIMEIALIVGGHVLGVLAAHTLLVRRASNHGGAIRSHTAMTVIMSFFTVATLWLLSLAVVK